MPTIIRPAQPADAPGIALVHTWSWQETYRDLIPDDLLDRMTSEEARERRETGWARTTSAGKTLVYVADQGGQIVAFASAGAPRDHPGYDTELYTLYSLRRVQGHGLGRALLQTVARATGAAGANNMALWVLSSNPTRQWYARQGATEAGEKTEDGLHEIRMVWNDLSSLTAAH